MSHRSATPGGIYIHIPFCVKKCRYCDFYSSTDRSPAAAFQKALQTEINLRQAADLPFDTIYFGGGTPTSIAPAILIDLLNAVRSGFSIQPSAEITLEVNPGTLSPTNLERFFQAGFNRLSIGIQSFSDANLRFLGRIHTAREADQAITSARRAGFSNISLDLIFGLPGQTEPAWQTDLQAAIRHKPEHLSCYMLTYEKGTPLYKDLENKRTTRIEEQTAADLFTFTQQYLHQNGYQQYEISSYAKSAADFSRHNRKYWNFAPYLGFGPAAHSFQGNTRTWNHASVRQYIEDLLKERLPVADREILTTEQQQIEALYLGLRQTAGVDMGLWNRRFGVTFQTLFAAPICTLQDRHLIRLTDATCALTASGMRYLDSVVDLFLTSVFQSSLSESRPDTP